MAERLLRFDVRPFCEALLFPFGDWVTVPFGWVVAAPLGEPELVPFCDPIVAPLLEPWLGVPSPLFGACWPELVVAPAEGWLPGVEDAPPEELEPACAIAMAPAKNSTVMLAINPFTMLLL